MTTAQGDPGVIFSGNSFSDSDKKKALFSGQKQKKLPNPFSCTAPSFMKRPIKEYVYNRDDHSHIYCYTPQLCDRVEEANMHVKSSFVPFIQVDE